MELIPAIDVMDGKCVRLSKGDFNKKTVYSNNPLEIAKGFQEAGVTSLHIVDLDGANGEALKNLRVLENISANTSLIIDFGGGIKTNQSIKSVFNAGATMISLGSVIIKSPALFSEWISEYGPDKFLPGADVLDKKIKIHGWKESTGTDIFNFTEDLLQLNINKIFCTDISKDGMMQGPSVELYKEILKKFPSLYLIASGGISCYDDLFTLQEAGCKGAIIGKAFYEGKITTQQITDFIKNN
ncbi:1-(5-phosphoribosyl)-5-[(5-phosphoribosylamino)methylideneamino]imidazole-4-carboxamide isomerase [Ginsengibacter hankyongi]|uniref:1-(5-phosphoribosyl)-5-[(5-phosphoribosylamino)methylideneamino] imidazole-4-carboxamide isomerase n=1 Tax=Ginsengibacter hankyongi TaxID=2607284 RepID=A0A5J5II76_9BACT|nr:1-(5-phosphoribosyl)-5-[(5-phosphoribosylamino)methylideneamino]imidazole-4-carboxamide isomerase [Ginsengibacter hankyongi]KAA9040481.1 1-(5-phosphoribosyl)-5-[(5-phosphoribosylamino)methylideneamino]imidazole-4-carboxamide isomerase [Ginsengibacter hankyongi]